MSGKDFRCVAMEFTLFNILIIALHWQSVIYSPHFYTLLATTDPPSLPLEHLALPPLKKININSVREFFIVETKYIIMLLM